VKVIRTIYLDRPPTIQEFKDLELRLLDEQFCFAMLEDEHSEVKSQVEDLKEQLADVNEQRRVLQEERDLSASRCDGHEDEVRELKEKLEGLKRVARYGCMACGFILLVYFKFLPLSEQGLPKMFSFFTS
jgi:DNA-directed RNA polymerase subunit M/transcription elongation factor TFIIS